MEAAKKNTNHFMLTRGLIVSCQADESEALVGSGIMARMAMAAESGGAEGLRVNGARDIREIREVCKIPIIGILKREYPGYEPFITPSLNEVDELMLANPDVIAIDATFRKRPGFPMPQLFISSIKAKYEIAIMADVSTYEEGANAWLAGADIIATTLSSYTSYTLNRNKPDIELIRRLTAKVDIPVIAEGNILTPEMAKACYEAGAYAVVVGGAITRPDLITKRFVDAINQAKL